MRCPMCGSELRERNGSLRCDAGDMELSIDMRRRLAEAFLSPEVPEPPDPATTRWGGRWFCPADGTEMVEADGRVQCPSCTRAMPGGARYQLIELHPHRPLP